jgi:REP element-mobilizing transposase RayT
MPDPHLEAYWQSRLNEAPWVLDDDARRLMLQITLTVCERRQWTVYAVHVRTNHIHTVISANVTPERVLCDLKAYSTRAFRCRTDSPRRRHWANHGSTRYLWNQASVNAAIDYVLNGQGVAMARYPSCDVEKRSAEGALTLSGSDSD